MITLLPALAFAFAAFCVWLTVLIVNRRERCAKWTLVAVALSLYPLSFGPIWWLASRGPFQAKGLARVVYRPLIWSAVNFKGPVRSWVDFGSVPRRRPMADAFYEIWYDLDIPYQAGKFLVEPD
jgi:hypothetical protein